MFSGIIEELGTIKDLKRQGNNFVLVVNANKLTQQAKEGSSIAVNGTCLTVTANKGNGLSFDVMPETAKRTDLGNLKKGDKVNLERALAADGRFEGHIVQGHVDATGTIQSTRADGNAVIFYIKTNPKLTLMMVEKGSIAVDGISLTVVEVKSGLFSVSIIPFTLKNTTLGFKKAGSKVNLEVDIIGKYVAKYLKGVRL
ncbi:MAG: riboflavin synthase [Actinobacteria bacterium]|nr:MAG: riboflavin synthase [Actinomycetota bacterium]